MDVILQMHNQSYAHRVCLLAQNPNVFILPGGKFGESAEELGPKKSMHHGPNLVMLRKCTASKAEIIAHIHTTFLRRYVARIYWCRNTAPTKEAVAARVAEELCQMMRPPVATNSKSFTRSDSPIEPSSAENEERGNTTNGTVCADNGELERAGNAAVGVEGTRTAEGASESGRLEDSKGDGAETRSELDGSANGHDPGVNRHETGVNGQDGGDNGHESGVNGRDGVNGLVTSMIGLKTGVHDLEASANGHVASVNALESGVNGHGASVKGHVTDLNGHVVGGGQKIRLRIQACPKSLEEFFTDSLPDVEVGMARFTHVLGIAEVHAPHYGNSATKRWVYHYGISPANEVYFQRDLRGGVGFAGRGTGDLQCLHEGSVSKAVCKMEEVLEAVGWPLGRESTVIDLGAAPGAWTAYLARHVARVVAVDPAEMGADAMLDNVTHIRKAAIDARDDVATWQKDQLSDLLVCDINKHPKEVLKWAEPLYPFLRPGGLFIMTLKFFGKARDKSEALSILTPMLEAHFVDMDCIWLLANTVHERTLVARRR